jgi:hypothetical protein
MPRNLFTTLVSGWYVAGTNLIRGTTPIIVLQRNSSSGIVFLRFETWSLDTSKEIERLTLVAFDIIYTAV